MFVRSIQLIAVASLFVRGIWAVDDPFVGTWKLNPQESKMTGQKYTVQNLGGNKYRFTFGDDSQTIVADGTDQPSKFGGTWSVKQDGPNSWTEVEKHDVRKELEDRFGALPKSVENLLEYATLKSMSEHLRISSVERQGSRVAIRFYSETTLDPATLVSMLRSRKGIKLDPSGVLWMEVARGESVAESVRNVLLGLQGES